MDESVKTWEMASLADRLGVGEKERGRGGEGEPSFTHLTLLTLAYAFFLYTG